jgi:heme/copper-type cytochrome/quinol oxidase subunit 2
VAGNEQLTALTGTVLLAGFAVEGMTLLALGRLLTLHMFLGVLLIGPVLLKICSTGYRFIRYYTGSQPYVRKGPPAPILRLLAPVVILTSLAVLGTGVALALAGPGNGPWLFLHKASFVLWFGAMTVHVLTYAWRLPRILLGAPRGRARLVSAAGGVRWLAVVVSLAGGLVIALLVMRLAAPTGM